MRIRFTLVDPVVDTLTTVEVDADPSTPVGELVPLLAPIQPADGALYVDDGPIDIAEPLSASGLRDGALVGCGGAAPAAHDRAPSEPFEIRVVGGPHAGAVFRVKAGRYTVGRGSDADVRVPDPDLSRLHLSVTVAADGSTTVEDLGSTNGTSIHGRRIEDAVRISVDDVVHAGATLLSVERTDSEVAHTAVDAESGRLRINVSPRLSSTTHTIEARLDPRPERAEPSKFPILMLVLPLAMAGVLAAITKSATYLLFGLMSPVMYLGSHFQGKRSASRTFEKQMEQWRAANAAEQARLDTALAAEATRMRAEHPDPARVVLAARGPRRRLWERQPDDPRLGSVRVGTGAVPSAATVVEQSSEARHPKLHDVPVVVSLLDVGVVGVAGDPTQTEPLVRWIALQLAVLHSPDLLQLVVLAADPGTTWEWARWLPHTQFADRGAAMIGNTPDTISARIRELAALVEARRSAQPSYGSAAGPHLPLVVVVLDGASRLRAHPGVTEILQHGPAHGVLAVCIDTNEQLLPQEARATITFADAGTPRARVQVAGAEGFNAVLADGVSGPIADLSARAMAPLEKVGGGLASVTGTLPASLRLLDAISMPDPTPEQIVHRWRLGGRSSRSVVGRSTAGDFSIDIARDGPHALVAGTTGAGKSEFLMSFIASLAITNRPDAINFVLVDYKGGTAFKDCARLPHTTGMVTNLDAHLTERALVSLRAEITRREALFRDVGAKEIENYWEALAHANGTIPPMPRLLIIIDEFAILARELPDFIDGLIEIAQLGRAFGVHLVLATQRPSGAVSPDIRANSDLRIALRTKEPSDSMDVIDAPDAANIGKAFPGRGFMRSGQEPLVQFQAGRVGGRRPGAVSVVRRVPTVRVVGWDQVGLAPPDAASSEDQQPDDDAATDLHYIVESILAASIAEQIPAPASPLLPELPKSITLDEVLAQAGGSVAPDPLDVVFGLEDVPAQQRQVPATFRLGTGHTGIGGSARSGRTTFLRALAASIARTHWSSDVHLYGIDCGNQGLAVISQLPHCGAVANRTEPDRVARLLDYLSGEVTRRQTILTATGVSDIVEQRKVALSSPGSERLPFVVLLIDRWEGFLEALGEVENGRLKALVGRILKEGQSVGIQVVVAGDRYALYGEIGALMEHRLALRFNDREEYSFADIRARELPDEIAPGRAFRSVSQLEVQIAVLDRDLSGQSQSDAFRSLAAWATERDAAVPINLQPQPIRSMPTRVTLSELDGLGAATPERPMRLPMLLGVGGDDVSPQWIDLADDGPAFLVGGPPRSGKSSVLCALATQFITRGIAVILVAPKKSPLADMAHVAGVRRAFLGADAESIEFEDCLDATPFVVLVDDADLVDTANESLIELASRRTGDAALIVAGTTEFLRSGSYKSFVADARKSRCGMLLCPESSFDGQMLSLSLPRGTAITGPPGRGFLGVGGEHTLVQAAVADSE